MKISLGNPQGSIIVKLFKPYQLAHAFFTQKINRGFEGVFSSRRFLSGKSILEIEVYKADSRRRKRGGSGGLRMFGNVGNVFLLLQVDARLVLYTLTNVAVRVFIFMVFQLLASFSP